MADNDTNTATEMDADKQTETKPVETADEIKAELERTRKALKEANNEAAARRKRLEELEAAEQERQKAAMTESERLKAELDEATRKLSELSAANLKREIAEKVGLPPALALRIQGANASEMEADAQAMLEALPKPQATTPKLGATNPGSGATQGETDDQRRARLGLR